MSTAVKAAIAGALFLVGTLAGGLISGGRAGDPTQTDDIETPVSDSGEVEGQRPAAEPLQNGGPDDAVEAAVGFATASQDWLYLSDEGIESAIRAIAVPEAADRLSEETIAEISVARDALRHSAGPIWWFVRPLAVHADVRENTATVSVWVVTVLSAADVAVPQADWVTLDIGLVRSGETWLLESIVDTVGPTPASGVRDQPWQPEPFDDALAGYERIGSRP